MTPANRLLGTYPKTQKPKFEKTLFEMAEGMETTSSVHEQMCAERCGTHTQWNVIRS